MVTALSLKSARAASIQLKTPVSQDLVLFAIAELRWRTGLIVNHPVRPEELATNDLPASDAPPAWRERRLVASHDCRGARSDGRAGV